MLFNCVLFDAAQIVWDHISICKLEGKGSEREGINESEIVSHGWEPAERAVRKCEPSGTRQTVGKR